MKENRQGIFSDIPNDEYRSSEGISKSDLDDIARSIEYWKFKQSNPEERSEDCEFGSAFHDIILLPEVFKSTYLLGEKFDGRTSEGKAIKKKREALEAQGKVFLQQKHFDLLEQMKEKLLSNSLVRNILEGAKYEQSCWSFDNEFGLLKKCRPDILRDDCIIADIKTARQCDANYFRKEISNRNYDKQAAYYLDLVSALTGKPYKNFVFIVIEKTPPFGISIFDLDQKSIEVGRQLYKRDLEKYKSYLNSTLINESEIIQNIELPGYAYSLVNR